MTTPLPTPPNSVTRPTTFDADCDAFLGALTLFQTELNALQASLSPIGRNMLINGGFDINQRAAASNADDTYAHDRWNILTQTSTVAVSNLGPAIENGFNAAMRITQSQASAQRFGFAQIIEQANCIHLRNGSATLSGRVRCSQTTTIRYAVIGWTGTADVVTSDVVLSWTNATFTAGNFFTSTSTSVLATGSQAVTANNWTNLAALTATMGTSFNNVIVFVWTDSAQAQNVTLDCDYLQFEAGASSTPFEKRSIGTELLLCQRYAQVNTWANAQLTSVVQVTGANSIIGKIYDYPVVMRTTPTASLTNGFAAYNSTNSSNSALSLGTLNAAINSVSISASATGSILSAGNASIMAGGASGATLTLTAEL